MDLPPLALIGEDKKTSAQHSKQILRRMVLFTVIVVKSNVITIDGNGLPSTIFINRATPVPTKKHGRTRITPILDQLAGTIVSGSTEMERKEPP